MTVARSIRRIGEGSPAVRAYTLVEVLIVVVILGIAAALVVPNMSSTGVLRVQAAVRTIVADIAEAQADSLAFQKGRAIVFHPTENRYSVVEVNGSTIDESLDTIRQTRLAGNDFGNFAFVSVDFNGGGDSLIFDEMGGPVTEPGGNSPSPNGIIKVTGSEQAFTITVEAYTGRITVKRTSG